MVGLLVKTQVALGNKRVVQDSRRVVIDGVEPEPVSLLRPTGPTEVANHQPKVVAVPLRNGRLTVMPIKRSSLTATSNHHSLGMKKPVR